MNGKGRKAIAASELAKMGFCEAKVALDARRGEIVEARQASLKEDGRAEHARFLRDAIATEGGQSSDRRCFVATMVFGAEAEETQLLRAFRDKCLLSNRTGRLFVRCYYLASPGACAIARQVPGAKSAARWVLLKLIERLRT